LLFLFMCKFDDVIIAHTMGVIFPFADCCAIFTN